MPGNGKPGLSLSSSNRAGLDYQGPKIMKLPPLIYGTAWKQERTADLVEKAILNGFRGVDTACQPKHYNESGVGEALQRLKEQGIARDQLFIQTKFTPIDGHDPATIPYDSGAPISEQVRQSVHMSLKNLKVDYIDALLLHSPLSRHVQTMEAWHVLEELHRDGVFGRLGISNCYELDELKSIYEEASIKPSLLQNRFYAKTDYDKKLRVFCDETNITYQSFWTLTANPHLLSDAIVVEIAKSRNVTEAQVLFRFLTMQNIIPLIGSCSDEHMKQDLAIFNFSLTTDEINKIQSLL
jgi:diketogulonate reductase-like aldo/keto reductase